MSRCHVELHHLLSFAPFVFVPHPYVLQVFGRVLHKWPYVGLQPGHGSHAQLWRHMLICRQVNEIRRYILQVLLRWMPSPRCSSGLVSVDCINFTACSRCLLQLCMSGSTHLRLVPDFPSQHRLAVSSGLSPSCL